MTPPETPQQRATRALEQSRRYRHHKDCRCRMYAKSFCSAADALWQNAMNRELDLIPRPGDTNAEPTPRLADHSYRETPEPAEAREA